MCDSHEHELSGTEPPEAVQADIAPVVAFWQALGLPGLIDVHTHFMPKRVMDKVWQYFDSAGPLTAYEWPIAYRYEESVRLDRLRRYGVRAFTSLVYPHKPDMAAWLNGWASEFAAQHPDCLHTATFFPEPGAGAYVRAALESGAEVFKVHVQVGGFDPSDPQLDEAWGALSEAKVPAVIHCGSAPAPAAFTGSEPVARLLRKHPGLRLIIAHMGMHESGEFLDLADRFPGVMFDTAMVFIGSTRGERGAMAPERARLVDFGDRILFGSDFPNIPYAYAEGLRGLAGLDLGEEWLRAVCFHNAARLFQLAAESAPLRLS